MTVRVRYRGTELTPGVVEEFAEADSWKTTETGEIVLLQTQAEGDKRVKHRVGMVCEGTWLSVIAVEDDEAGE